MPRNWAYLHVVSRVPVVGSCLKLELPRTRAPRRVGSSSPAPAYPAAAASCPDSVRRASRASPLAADRWHRRASPSRRTAARSLSRSIADVADVPVEVEPCLVGGFLATPVTLPLDVLLENRDQPRGSARLVMVSRRWSAYKEDRHGNGRPSQSAHPEPRRWRRHALLRDRHAGGSSGGAERPWQVCPGAARARRPGESARKGGRACARASASGFASTALHRCGSSSSSVHPEPERR